MVYYILLSMKHKTIILILAVFLIICAAVSISAANFYGKGPGNNNAANPNCQYCNFTDANNDGICDNCKKGSSLCNGSFIDNDGDGICDNCNNKNSACDGSQKHIREGVGQQANSGNQYGQYSGSSGSGNHYGQGSGSQGNGGHGNGVHLRMHAC